MRHIELLLRKHTRYTLEKSYGYIYWGKVMIVMERNTLIIRTSDDKGYRQNYFQTVTWPLTYKDG